MLDFYNINNIELGSPSRSGHETYLGARLKTTDEKIIYKKNKYGIPLFSRFEVSFSQLAKLFLSPDLTSSQRLVIDNKKNIVGIAVEHLCYVIARKEGTKNFYTINNPKGQWTPVPHSLEDLTQIPIYFLNQLPQGFFAKLVNAEKKEEISIDYGSLASILTTSYTLEEDDLHKGNFGFYIVKKAGKPHVVFFKIDHDLMFVNSIMSFQTRRPFHWFHGAGAFDIAIEDLLSFPNLKISANSYWPTKFGYIANPFDNKEYHRFSENKAFSNLENVPAFNQAKWKNFYKHILVSPKLIKENLAQCADLSNSADRAHVALMTQAMVTRLAHLRAVLFSIKEFRDYVQNLSVQDKNDILYEIVPAGSPHEEKIQHAFTHFHQLCMEKSFTPGDTPLHVAIKLGEYRYEDSMPMFSRFLNTKNQEGKTPLDIAAEIESKKPEQGNNIQKNMRFIMKHLMEHGAKPTSYCNKAKLESLISYSLPNPYEKKLSKTTSYTRFRIILRNIGEDSRFCLKHQKKLALACIKHWIELKQKQPNFRTELEQLKKDINGLSTDPESDGLKYIRQLRSKLWIIRQVRGLYGRTTTQVEINELIDKASKRLNPVEPSSSCFSFFKSSEKSAAESCITLPRYNPVYT